MNEELSTDPERALQTTPVVCLGEASGAAASFYNALQRPAIALRLQSKSPEGRGAELGALACIERNGGS